MKKKSKIFSKNFNRNANKILSKAGFTLVELLTVMAILGILIAVAIAAVGIAQRGARDNTRTRDMASMQGALNDYYGYSQTRTYPANNLVAINSNAFTINSGSPLKVQQANAALVTTAITYDTTTRDISSCAGITAATPGGWSVACNVTDGGAGFLLCTVLENGTTLNLSTGR